MAKNRTAPSLPSKQEVLAFVSSQAGKAGTREIARAFGLKNADRAALKHMLRDLADEGKIERRRRKTNPAGALPSVVVAEVTGRDEDGEFVAIPTEWDEEAHGAAPKIRLHIPRRARPGEVAGVGTRVLLRAEQTGGPDADIRYTGRVIKIIDRARMRVLGIFRSLPEGGGRVEPVDKKQAGRELAVPPGATLDAADGDLVAVDIAQRIRGLPQARVKERLGSIKSEKAVSLIAIHAHGIPHVFPQDVLAEAEAAKLASLAGREDWRKLPLLTIDPEDAKDHDDAVHAASDTEPGNPGGHIITVAIADVAHYVRPGGALDREAVTRGNSVYFPDRVVPMLPERISNELCSLRPGEDRPALAVRMVIGADGVKRSHSFHRVTMRSAARLHYMQVQKAMDGWPDDATGPLIAPVLSPLYAAYHAVKRARDARGPLDLELPERKIVLTAHSTVDRVVTPERLDAHRLIEEFMILANVAAAETLERARVPLIYRVHDEPSLEKVEALRTFLATIGIRFPRGTVLKPALFNRILEQVKGSEYENLVNEIVLRSQAQAEYAVENYGHFGLALRRYAHFTSPIRRYADLVVHRALIRALGLGSDGLPEQCDVRALGEVAASISAAERRAMKAERETIDRLIAHFLADRVGATFEGHISGVTRAGLFIKLDDTGADGFAAAATLGRDYFRYEEASHALIGQATGETYRLADRVTVRLVEAAPVAGALRFEVLSSGRMDKAAKRSRSKNVGSTRSSSGKRDERGKKGRKKGRR